MADVSNISPRVFDGGAAWTTLSREHQERIGALVMEAAVGRAISGHAPDPAARAGAEAERIALDLLQDAALGVGGLLDLYWIEPKDGVEQFCIPSVLGAVCTTCGCSYEDPCEEGCGWHDAMTCTACAAHLKSDT